MSTPKDTYPTSERRYPADDPSGEGYPETDRIYPNTLSNAGLDTSDGSSAERSPPSARHDRDVSSLDQLDNAVTDLLIQRGTRELRDGRWPEAEQAFTCALYTPGARGSRRTVAVVGVSQARLFGRLDTRGAFTMLHSVLHADKRCAHAHVVAAMLFGTPDDGLLDRQRSATHTEIARRLLVEETEPSNRDTDLIALNAVGELFNTAMGGDAHAFLRARRLCEGELRGALSPVTRCLVLEAEAMGHLAAGDLDEEEATLDHVLRMSREIGFAAAEARVLSRLARRAVERGKPHEAIAIIDEATGVLANAGAATSWVQLALAETRKKAIDGKPHKPQSFAVAANGVRTLAHHVPKLLELGARPAVIAGPATSTGAARGDLEDEIRRLAPSRVTVLIVGGTASIKALVARALHDRSGRARQPFVTVDCATLPSEEIEKLLFGVPEARGAIDEAGRGTLYIASIDDLPLSLQPRFMKFLDEATSLRVVASTRSSAPNELQLRVVEGRFRKDLGERLELVRIVLTTLA